jgi:hypothetical protein
VVPDEIEISKVYNKAQQAAVSNLGYDLMAPSRWKHQKFTTFLGNFEHMTLNVWEKNESQCEGHGPGL